MFTVTCQQCFSLLLVLPAMVPAKEELTVIAMILAKCWLVTQ